MEEVKFKLGLVPIDVSAIIYGKLLWKETVYAWKGEEY